jgi:hypothetical protein
MKSGYLPSARDAAGIVSTETGDRPEQEESHAQ